MELKLYKVIENYDVINKRKTLVTSMMIRLKRSTDILNPILIIKSELDLINLVNYCYIPDLERYYFINGIEPYPNGVYRLQCQVDVLESFKTDILKVKSHTTETGVNVMMNIYKSSVKLNQDTSYILTTLGDD